jgi:S1-C subfamily serine protease
MGFSEDEGRGRRIHNRVMRDLRTGLVHNRAMRGLTGLLLCWLVMGTEARVHAGETAQTLRAAVVRVEVATTPWSVGADLALELACRQPWTPYEAELSRRLRMGSTGTGFFVNPQGDLVTNAHVVLSGVRYRKLPFTQSEWDCLARLLTESRQVWVTVGEGEEARSYAAAPVAIAEELDLAVLRVCLPPGQEARFSYLPIGSSEALRVGQPVVALGFPENGFQASAGKVLSLIQGLRVHDEMRLTRRASPATGEPSVTVSGTSAGPVVRFQHSALTGHGSSGGPLLDERDRVIGVAYALLADRARPQGGEQADLNLAIVSNVLRQFLRNHAIRFVEASR